MGTDYKTRLVLKLLNVVKKYERIIFAVYEYCRYKVAITHKSIFEIMPWELLKITLKMNIIGKLPE